MLLELLLCKYFFANKRNIKIFQIVVSAFCLSFDVIFFSECYSLKMLQLWKCVVCTYILFAIAYLCCK